MHNKTPRRSAVVPLVEALEDRRLLSAAPTVHAHAATATSKTSLHLSRHSAELGQDVALSVTVKAPKRAGVPAGTIQLLDNGSPVEAAGQSPNLTLDAKGRASYTFGTGGIALFTGRHSLTAQFVSSNTLPGSLSRPGAVNVRLPRTKKAADGLQTAKIKAGKGRTRVKAGQMVAVAYTGLLASSGEIFDFSAAHQPSYFTFTVEASPEQVIPGFDEGVVGMKVGETRVLEIPSALGYGAEGSPPAIPANADLIFLITLLGVQ